MFTELFSHLLNTFYMMPNHCTDRNDAVGPFNHTRGRAASVMLLNGLDPEWWNGSVYGNPPYGRIIERTRKQSQNGGRHSWIESDSCHPP